MPYINISLFFLSDGQDITIRSGRRPLQNLAGKLITNLTELNNLSDRVYLFKAISNLTSVIYIRQLKVF